MATATRSVPANLVDSLEDEPEGSVPSPFPIFHVQPLADLDKNTQRRFNSASSIVQGHAVESQVSSILMEAFRSIAEVQICATRALEAFLELHLLPVLWSKLRHAKWRPPVASTSTAVAVFDYATELRTIARNLVELAEEPEIQATSAPAQSLATISRLMSSHGVSAIIPDVDKHLMESLLNVLTHATGFVDDPQHHSIQHQGCDPSGPVDYTSSLANLQQSLARLLQSSALDTLDQKGAGISSLPPAQHSLTSTHLGDASLSLLNGLSRRRRGPTNVHRLSHDSELPPEYEYGPPAYVNSSSEDAKSAAKVRHIQSAPDLGRLLPRSSFAPATTEKDRIDLDTVTLAIERLYTVAPQIRGQRVELNSSKKQELELARIMGTLQRLGNRLDSQRARGGNLSRSASEHNLAVTSGAKGKGRAEDVGDLENFLEMISGAQRSHLVNQRAAVSENASIRLRRVEAAKARDAVNREAFVDRIQQSVEKGRLQTQDAVFSPRLQDKATLLTLPEFIKESRSDLVTPSTSFDSRSGAATGNTSLAMSRQGSNASNSSAFAIKRKRSFFSSRPRSNSAPAPKSSESTKIQNKQGSEPMPEIAAFQYVAEHQENLRIVSVLVTLPEQFRPSSKVSATLARSYNDESATAIDLRLGPQSSVYNIELPVPVSTLGTNALSTRLEGDHLELRANVDPSWVAPEEGAAPLLDAARLNSLKPVNFICSSCSLPLIRCRDPNRRLHPSFSDLPSEYWSELVEAWMCHSEQKISAGIARHGKGGAHGVQPSPTQALVGGSYILVDATIVIEANLRISATAKPGAEWRQLRCICGAALGARQAEADKGLTTYRFAKYAIRPMSSHISYDKVPLSAYIIADMLEIVHAHASYRFVIRDEEAEEIRILVWLFNPSVRISHSISRAYALPGIGSSHAAKVMFKLVGPTETLPADRLAMLQPDFAAAEHLFYPLSVCHSLAVLLRNSNIAYPESSRKMGALSLGWLRRV